MTDEYDAIARRFFNEFLQLKLMLDAGSLSKPKNYDKELAQYKKAAEQFKTAAQDLAKENGKLEEALALAEEQLTAEKGRVNELLIAIAALKERGSATPPDRRETGYSFVEHMDEESRRVWDSLMRQIPYRGTKDTEGD